MSATIELCLVVSAASAVEGIKRRVARVWSCSPTAVTAAYDVLRTRRNATAHAMDSACWRTAEGADQCASVPVQRMQWHFLGARDLAKSDAVFNGDLPTLPGTAVARWTLEQR